MLATVIPFLFANMAFLETRTKHNQRKVTKFRRMAVLVFALIAGLLGGLWLLQGLRIVHLRPVLGFVDCAPQQGLSALLHKS